MLLQNLQQLLTIGARSARKHSPFEFVDLFVGFSQGVGEKLILVAERGDSSAGHWEESSWDGRSMEREGRMGNESGRGVGFIEKSDNGAAN